jgi:hypothetical protein
MASPPQTPLLLLAGTDIRVLQTQVMLFKLAQCEAVVVHSPEAARLALTNVEVRGVVIGPSLHSEAREQIASDARAIRPGAAILELVEGYHEPENLVSWARSIGWAGLKQPGSSQYGPTA